MTAVKLIYNYDDKYEDIVLPERTIRLKRVNGVVSMQEIVENAPSPAVEAVEYILVHNLYYLILKSVLPKDLADYFIQFETRKEKL